MTKLERYFFDLVASLADNAERSALWCIVCFMYIEEYIDEELFQYINYEFDR